MEADDPRLPPHRLDHPQPERSVGAGLIERQLAHFEVNKVRGAYNAAQYIEQRTRMMFWSSDYLDQHKDISDLLG